MEESAKDPAKKLIPSLIINGSMSIYALGTFIGALKAGVAWRILLSATGLLLFITALVIIVLKMLKLRREQQPLQP